MSSPLDQIYEQASQGSAGGVKVGIGSSDLAPRNSLFESSQGQQSIMHLFDKGMDSFNSQAHGIFTSAIERSHSVLDQLIERQNGQSG